MINIKELNNVIAILSAKKKFELKHEILLHPQDNYVCVRYLYCGICGGDYSAYLGYRQEYPVSLGHEFVGEVVAVGKNVKNIIKGQLVISDFNYRCGECYFCKKNMSHLCMHNNIQLFSNRGFAKYANIHIKYLLPIDVLNYIPRACLIEPLSCVIHASKYVNIKKETNVLICGGGSIGMLFCFYLNRIIKNVNIVVNELNESRLLLLIQHFHVLQYKENLFEKYDLIIDCSNTKSGLMFSLNHAEQASTICIMSHLYGHNTSFVYEQLCKKELKGLFPLRNGETNNLLLAKNYIKEFWTNKDDDLIQIYQNIYEAFDKKEENSKCKQIIDVQKSLS